MLSNRIIPCLLLKNQGLYKTEKFKNPKYVGDPINAIKIFNDKEVDELVVLDIEASKKNREPDYDMIEEFASECFMPLCYGGGITNLEQATRIFSLGVEKICIQTAALKDLTLIQELSKKYGNQSILVSVDIKKNWAGKYQLYSSESGKTLKRDWRSFVMEAIAAGAGEIVLNNVDADGTRSGLDLNLIKLFSQEVNVPLIVGGGTNSIENMKEGIENGANAISVGAFFVFQGPHKAVLITYPSYKDLEQTFKNI